MGKNPRVTERYVVVSQFFGRGKPLGSLRAAESEVRKLIDLAPDDEPWIDVVDMTKAEYQAEMDRDD